MADDWSEFAEVSTDDALASLTQQGIVVTSGFRTPEDVARLKREGYTPASQGGHLNGDGVDLVPGKSGMTLEQLAEVARERFGPKAVIGIHNGSHVDVKVPGWGNAPDVYRKDPWSAFDVVEKAKPEVGPTDTPRVLHPSGEVHDGDTFGLASGGNARLLGMDAFELNQTGRSPSGETIPLGTEARDTLGPYAVPSAEVTATGEQTYGRPVVTLDNGGDAGEAVIRKGYGLAEPQYLKDDPNRFHDYMEAERLARLNLLGAHGNTYQTPENFRHGDQTAVFFDDPLPLEGLRPEIAKGYQEVAATAKSAEELLAYAKANGFEIRPGDAEKFIEARDKSHGEFDPTIRTFNPDLPRPLIDPKDGAFGTTARGFGDPFNAIDELGGVADTLGDTGGRENVWNSDRRFGDILWNNIDQNRAIIAHDEETHPYYRLGGQLASAAILPGAAVEGGLARIGVGAAEGAAQGLMGGEGSFTERLPDAAVGTVVGAAGGAALHGVIEAAPVVARAGRKLLGRDGQPVEEAAVDAASPTTYAAMNDEMPGEVLSRAPDRIDVQERPLVAPGTPEQRAAVANVEPGQVAPPSLNDLAKAGNINLKNIDKPEDIDALMKFTANSFDEFKMERRGEQSWAATEALAKDLGMTPDELLGRQTGEAFNAEQSLAARNLLHASADETRKLAETAVTGTEADKAAFVKSFLLHAAITEKASGAAAEAGRALNIYRRVAKASLGDRQAIQEAVKRLQDGASVDDVAALVNSLADDPAALNRFARDAIKPAFKDKLMFVWINSLLSGPKTHIVNMTSNLATALMDAPETALAAGLGGLRTRVKATAKGLIVRPASDRILFSEIGPRLYGTLRGAGDALAAAKKGWGEEAGGKIDAVRPAIGGTAGKIIGIPTRLLNVEDEVFKAMARRSEMAGMAVRKGRMEGLKGPELKSRIDDLLTNPTDEMKQAAADAALYKTFQRPLGPAMQKVSSAIQSAPVLRLFVPFIRTPTNLLKYAIERSPAAPLLKEVRQDFIAGGVKRDLAVAKMTLGTGIAALVSGLAEKGHLTGNGPADPSAKTALEAQGWQPYSIKVGDEYISYRRLDPWATILGTAADAVELQSAMTEKQERDAGAVVAGAIVHNLASKTWLSGLSDLVDAVTDPQANLKNTITRLGASIATPTLASQITQIGDPAVRDTTDPSYMGQLRKKIEARIPGLSKDVIPRRDISGKEVKSEGGALARLLSPFDTRQVRRDPVAKAIYDSGARFSVPSRQVGGGRLSDQDFDNYQQLAAQSFYDAMKETLADPDWLTMSRDERRKEIEKIKDSSRKEARSELFGLEH